MYCPIRRPDSFTATRVDSRWCLHYASGALGCTTVCTGTRGHVSRGREVRCLSDFAVGALPIDELPLRGLCVGKCFVWAHLRTYLGDSAFKVAWCDPLLIGPEAQAFSEVRALTLQACCWEQLLCSVSSVVLYLLYGSAPLTVPLCSFPCFRANFVTPPLLCFPIVHPRAQ